MGGSIGTTFVTKNSAEWNPWLKGSGPLDEGDATSPVILADLSGMRSASKVAAGLNFLRWQWETSADAQRALCRRVFADPRTAPDSITDVIRKAVDAAATDAGKTRVRDSVLTYITNHRCSRHRIPEDQLGEFEKLVDYGRIWLAGISGEYGRTLFKYADTIGVAYTKKLTEPYALSVGAGVYLPDARMLLAVSLRHERSSEGGTARDYCIPVGTTPALQCRSLALGPPEDSELTFFTAETRWFINDQFGLSPRVTADLSGNRGAGVELPILVRQQADKGFTSAIAIGWRSKQTSDDVDDRLYVSLIVGVTFGIGLKL
jgi:hypothetical protein